ncbi:MAG: RHS repeat-associated core domain-containing protein [Oscillospiraceae bacterium]|nr:RHS repeat-associated core domain-containing protein [Oscillospiraceae bacterium]
MLSITGESTEIGELNPIRYRGYYQDVETGLYYLQSRYYDPATMRFINADDPNIIQMGSAEKQELNLYAYCVNDPVNRIDPTGYINWWLLGKGVYHLTSALWNLMKMLIRGTLAAILGSWKAKIIGFLLGTALGAMPLGQYWAVVINVASIITIAWTVISTIKNFWLGYDEIRRALR